ncbi:DNA replication and repair protein RecF [termite gut metagenome]|uniref:DNA replication and repair protein RecF n=1 Tax=termite gut metagenome TaxID=433724 RepID=A0A5J4SRQ9_9ZZZZ
MTEQELKQIKVNKQNVSITTTKRKLINALRCERRTCGNVGFINKFLKDYEIETYPSYIYGNIDDTINVIYKPNNIPLSKFKLYFLSINGYKNLNNISIDFENTENYCAFIGLNGSGKSNVLESVSAIFKSLYYIATLDYSNSKKHGCSFSYTICYALDGIYYHIKDDKLLNGGKLNLTMLPKNIIASYSGEDIRLWENYYKPVYENYCNELIVEKQGFSPPFLFYVNRDQWEIAMLVLLYSEDFDVKSFIDELIGEKQCVISFEFVNENFPIWEETATAVFVEKLKEKGKYTINEFRDCINTISFIDQSSSLFYYLYRSSTDKGNRLIAKINISFGDGSSLEGLSEGEKRMILINTIIHILATQNSLCLFDEPDSHIHISRKTDLIKLINNAQKYSILTTHSPVFLGKMDPKNIRFLDRGKIKSMDILEQISNISNGEFNYIEGAFVLTSKYTIVVEGTYDIKYIKKAIEIFSNKDNKYKKLRKVAFVPMGSADNAQSFFNDVIINLLRVADKILYVFDYDQNGVRGWKKINELKNTHSKLEQIYYQDNYTSIYDSNSTNITQPFYVEDLFDENCYSCIMNCLHSKKKYKEFKVINQKVHDMIKNEIQRKYELFAPNYYNGFQSLLDKILNVFSL